jgi:hypothetical protein
MTTTAEPRMATAKTGVTTATSVAASSALRGKRE